ncbi:hypothetical protein [Poseidonibacter ostreae]|jgi:hypothetical protein|uniref:Uncharacterized protein n=1 Tax=Poseidonibacter ostreae TaxID=2654171 RepID=A0ABQ6VKN7_9BACT|nr:hypothetical protein [Poseidonibacter ostreae]KAB7885403.1 hypothetical protein GA417_08700 [Poseidonibacter ostreae]KAB7890565.1 hypothetical protein GBG18_08540 [Poseidonibacter ostreae]MAC85167.1 hypothetical protein [Arcobacter sp.]
MNYNIVVIVSIVICAILSLLLSYYGVLIILDEDSSLFKITQLIVAIVSMTTFYAPIKHLLLKYMDVDESESENIND